MSFINNKSQAIRRLQARLFNSRFFTISVLLHLVLLLVVGSTVIYKQSSTPADFTGGGEDGKFVQDNASQVPPPPPTQQDPTLSPTIPDKDPLKAIRVDSATATAFVAPVIAPVVPTTALSPAKANVPTAKMGSELTAVRAQAIRSFTKDWSKGHTGLGTSTKEREFEFVAYLAKYGDPSDPSRGGDWASTNTIRDGRIAKGSLPNLLFFIKNFSKGKIKANPVPEPLDLASQDIFIKKPPFIFFTGHRDFVLSDKEVENLQKYVQMGGCIWGDSSLPGRRSRFDLAFRREMRRVIPDADKDWELLPPTYPMFTKNLYYPEIKAPPSGVNLYKEPVYALRFGGEVAIIYTANDYGDMWRIALNDKLEVDKTHVAENTWDFLYSDNGVFDRMEFYYRGLEVPKLINSYKFGTNVVIHLLTRWEDRLKSAPAGL